VAKIYKIPSQSETYVWSYSALISLFKNGSLVKISDEEYLAASGGLPSQYINRYKYSLSYDGLVHREGDCLYFAGHTVLGIVYHKLDLTDAQVLVEIFKMKLSNTLPEALSDLL